ncbi:hypothetical protein JCGZ_24217 [Jatropha curcas]|uniref:Uncharacterized protein n=1 Tax=Jatropha curcas TaxID=180498 RepID=A0A067L4B3_JATCU|nr:hypothetical protein JCGZ_24217 [Jatropha curcas]
MARGRTVDSDTSGSGPRRGRGRGRSTRGREGTIPPSSLGTSGASSFAQPPVPPSLPSALSEPRNKLSLVAGHIYPSSQASRQNMRIIKLHPDKDRYTWDVIPQEAKDFYWEEFQGYYGYAKSGLGKLCALGYADFTYRMRKSSEKQQSVSQEIWESWQKAWEDPTFMRKREIFAQNRRSETGGDGAGPSRQTGGSIFAIETSRLLAKKYGREPTPMEVFTYTHTKDHDGNTFVDRRALGVNESQFYCGSALCTSATTSGPQPDHNAEEITALQARVDEQERQLVELRAHVMRMSDQPSAGTSSFDPPPTTDQDVSIALHQPLPSPLDHDTADDTMVTPTDTTAHSANTPPSATTLDRADDQPRRFDFGPF